jgi:hypothetical protein
MANMASVAYAIEGPKETLQKINEAIVVAVNSDDKRYELYQAAEYLKLPITDGTRLGGEISEEPTWDNSSGALRFSAEERWGLQDFAELLEEQFSDIKVYFIVEEPGMEIYFTNDREGKYFKDRFYVDTCIDNDYKDEYFETEKDAYEWIAKITKGKVSTKEEVNKFNEECGEDEFILVHKFEIV